MSPALLEAVAGNATGTTLVVEDELVIGRHAPGAGRLADDEEISRAHARVTVDASNFCAIEDLGSTNGTFVNGLRVSAPQILAEGDTIELGGTTLVVRELPTSEPTQLQPPVEAPAEAASRSDTIVSGESPVGTEPFLPDSPPTPAAGKVSLRLEIDFDARSAQVVLDDGAEPLHLHFDGSAWRSEKGPPA